MKASPIISAFNTGEISPLLASRVDLKYYPNGCKKMRNFIPMVQGPARRRTGTKFASAVKDSTARTWLRRFVFNQDQSYMIEFGHLYARFYTNGGVIESAPGTPFEIATPFTSASLTRTDGTFRLQFTQSGDVLYITSDGQFAPQKLTRLTASTFSIAAVDLEAGPFEDVDPDSGITVYATAKTGAVTLKSSAALFTAAHVGALFYIEQASVDSVVQWEPGKVISAAGAVRRSDGKNYESMNAATTGGVKPIHSDGARYDGDAGVKWNYLDPGYGWVKITGFTSDTEVSATVLSTLPASVVSASAGAVLTVNGMSETFTGKIRVTTTVAHSLAIGQFVNYSLTYDDDTVPPPPLEVTISGTAAVHYVDGSASVVLDVAMPANFTAFVSGTIQRVSVTGASSDRWAFGAFSDANGWPDNVAFFRERLCFSKLLKVYGSVSGDFENFNRRDDGGLITADMAFVSDITSDEANAVVWMAPFSSNLLVGTTGEEFSIGVMTNNDPFGPGNIAADRQSKHGSGFAGSVIVGDGVLHTQSAGRKVRDMVPSDAVANKWMSSDSTVLAEHITKGGIVSMAYQQEPDSVVWCARSDGVLIGFTLNREQDVRGWHPHRVGGYSDAIGGFAIVECVDVIPVNGSDELWMIVRRHINGATKRYIEILTPMRDDIDDQEDAFYVDCGLTLDNTINATLTPGAGATVDGTTGVVFTAGTAAFVAGDVGRRIHYRYSVIDAQGDIHWYKSVAEITGFTDTTHVTVTVHTKWPSLTAIPANGWRMTVLTISGLGHLEGEEVTVCGDGSAYGFATVSAGSITLTDAVSKAHVGFPFRSVLTPMPLEAGATDGTAQGKTKRISRCTISFNDTLGAKYGREESSELDIVQPRDVYHDLMDTAPALFTGLVTVAWPDGYDGQALITIVQDDPLPCTVTGIMPQITTQDSR
jgi:hypothetical protein